MNKILELKGKFKHSKNTSGFGPINLPKGAQENPITLNHLQKLVNQLNSIYNYWSKNTLIKGALTTVYYREIVAKSNRLGRLLREQGVLVNENIRGAKYNEDSTKHIFTYFNSLTSIQMSIEELQIAIHIVEQSFGDKITQIDLENINEKNIDFSILSKTNFSQIIKDAYFVEDFTINMFNEEIEATSIISIYKTNIDTKLLLRTLGINLIDEKMLDETTIRLTPDEFGILQEKAPYLVAMTTVDLSKLVKEDIEKVEELNQVAIPSPTNEPTIGVIDTLFDERVYFNEWVNYTDMVSNDIPKGSNDYFHGTSVTSIIVDGCSINPNLDDGCGRFRVKHFGVACGGEFSSFSILKSIKQAVRQNPNIKVWNLSLGSSMEIKSNYISPEAAELDKIQSEYDVVFVVAGTNKSSDEKREIKIGAPADSINSIVVNAVDFRKKPASYHRVGPVLSFFTKPDLSYYGGDTENKIKVCSNIGEYFVTGTSFAAPWIARKMAYLIEKLGFNREVAKALLIDAAAGWDRKDSKFYDIGYGIVPIHIKDIVGSENDEIKFVFSSATEEYETSAFNIPIPLNKDNKYPYISRATLCYFPECSRNQGVDYTDTEIDFQFGRVQQNAKGKLSLKSFNGNKQGEIDDLTKEKPARFTWRKWDNVKHLADWGKQSKRVKTSYEGEVCGVKMTVKHRLTTAHKTIPFGLVITLKEINGINRISDFIKRCEMKGWFVHEVDIENRIDINNIAEEEIDFE